MGVGLGLSGRLWPLSQGRVASRDVVTGPRRANEDLCRGHRDWIGQFRRTPQPG